MPERNSMKFAAGLRMAWILSRQDMKNRYASSYAGIAWNIGVPLLYAVINVTVFSILMSGRMGSRYGDVPFALFYFVPFALWTVFAEMSARSVGVLKEYSYLINKIAFPSWVLPLVPLTSALLNQLVIFCLIAGLMVVKGIPPAGTLWIFAIIWALSLVMAIGASYAISAVSVYVPDVAQIVPVGINVLFWLTPILYPASMVETHGSTWVRSIVMTFNPFYYMVESARFSVLGGSGVAWSSIGVLALSAAAFLAIGVAIHRKLQPGFADVI